MALIFCPVTAPLVIFAVSTALSVSSVEDTTSCLSCRLENGPVTSPLDTDAVVISSDALTSPVFAMVKSGAAPVTEIPAPAVRFTFPPPLPVSSACGSQTLPFHFSTWPVWAPMLLIFAPLTAPSAISPVPTAPAAISSAPTASGAILSEFTAFGAIFAEFTASLANSEAPTAPGLICRLAKGPLRSPPACEIFVRSSLGLVSPVFVTVYSVPFCCTSMPVPATRVIEPPPPCTLIVVTVVILPFSSTVMTGICPALP